MNGSDLGPERRNEKQTTVIWSSHRGEDFWLLCVHYEGAGPMASWLLNMSNIYLPTH